MDLRALQQIRIVELDRVAPFEWDDESRAEFVLGSEGVLRDPLLVTPLEDDRLLLLDDSRLYYSLIDAGMEHLPVQVCPPVQLIVYSDPLGFVHFSADDLSRAAARFPDRVEFLPMEKKVYDSPDHINLVFRFIGASPIRIRIRHSTRSGCPAPLDGLFRSILDNGSYFPIPESGEEAELVSHVPSYSGMVNLPPFELDDLRLAVASDRLFPPGLMQVQAACRVLNIDFPLRVLADQSSAEEKQSFLSELIGLRARRRRIACYDGRIYMLNR